MDFSNKKIVIVGGGPVGALNACFFAKRGYQVEVYEMRGDIRLQGLYKGKSLNLALSVRGQDALKEVGIEEEANAIGIPMYGRMIHDRDGKNRPIPYGRTDQALISVDRRRINEVILDAAEKYPNVKTFFSHKFVSCDFDTGVAIFQNEWGEQVEVQSDFITGCDGSYSAVRRQVMKSTRFDYSQEYIPHGYMELSIPANEKGEFAMATNYLHIWARNTFMMIGLPNQPDNSFVLSLFMPFEMFERIQTEQELLDFFQEQFPDAVPLIGKKPLVEWFFSLQPHPLISIKCSPYHVKNRAVLMGDAAHAMFPFYGQGMNAGFEDILILHDLLDKYQGDFEKALPEYTQIRHDDAKAIVDLCLVNYIEMREGVNSRLYLLRKKLDSLLNYLFPNSWIPLYSTVSFTRIPYHQCINHRNWQDKVLTTVLTFTGVATAVSLSTAIWQVKTNSSFTTDGINNMIHAFRSIPALHILDKLRIS